MFKRGRPTTAPRIARKGEKWCPGHKEFHRLDAFWNDITRVDGKQNYCKDWKKEERRNMVKLTICDRCGIKSTEVRQRDPGVIVSRVVERLTYMNRGVMETIDLCAHCYSDFLNILEMWLRDLKDEQDVKEPKEGGSKGVHMGGPDGEGL